MTSAQSDVLEAERPAPYVSGRVMHDADTHIMELPDCLEPFVDPAFRNALREHVRGAKASRIGDLKWVDEVVAKHDDAAFRADADANIMLRKRYDALGSFRKQDRARALDDLGFASQLVFTTFCLGNFGLDHGEDMDLCYAAATAHNRMMVDFCSVDRRLLPTAHISLADRERAPAAALEAIALGAKGLIVNSRCPKGHAPSHADFDRLWAIAQDAGLPIIFHVGGQEKMHTDYVRNGAAVQLDWLGGSENFTSLTFMAIPNSVMQTMAALIFDGVLDRFPRLKFGAIELGASWLPSWMKFMDASHQAFYKEERQQRLSAPPSEIVRRQFRATPYCHEDAGWIIREAGPEVAMFSSDYPHAEGGRNPVKRFDDTMRETPEPARRRFYRDNFIDLMGAGLDPALHDGGRVAS
jgi:predicted TIM-barrel fold metal-dependent hydrolase